MGDHQKIRHARQQVEQRVAIAAIATPAGNGGIGVVRLSGQGVVSLMPPLFGKTLAPRQATFTPFFAADGSVVDQGLAVYFPAPHSFTGEDVIELHGHGGQVVMNLLLKRCIEAGQDIGMRQATAGEFSLRAFFNGKIDLLQAEAIADLIAARSEAAARSAQTSLSGIFSQQVQHLVEQIIHLRTLVEATLDFPEEEIDFLQAARAKEQLDNIRAQVDRVFAAAQQGARLRQGIKVVIVGAPNVGKSSLLNALAGDDVAIVSPIAGTTRDRVSVTLEIAGVHVEVVDTAGLRESSDEIEKIGVKRSYEALTQADMVLWVEDINAPQSADIPTEVLTTKSPWILVLNKADTIMTGDEAQDIHIAQQKIVSPPQGCSLSVLTSCTLPSDHRYGVMAVRQAITQVMQNDNSDSGDSPLLARARHLQALTLCRERLLAADEFIEQGNRQLELLAEELRHAQHYLEELTGVFSNEALLGRIFSTFCIGK